MENINPGLIQIGSRHLEKEEVRHDHSLFKKQQQPFNVKTEAVHFYCKNLNNIGIL